VAMAIQKIVQDGISADEAVEYLMSIRGQNMDLLQKYLSCDDGCCCCG